MIKKLSKSIREYKRATIATPLLVSVEVIMECLIPFLTANLVNDIKAGCGMPVIMGYAWKLVLMAIVSLAFGVAAGFSCSTASCGFGRNLRKDLFYAVQDFSFENIDKFSTSSLVTRMTTDVNNVQFAFMMIIRTAVRAPFMLIFAFFMAFYMGGRMAWIFVFVIPILAFSVFLIARNAMPLFRAVFHKYDKLNNSIQENVKGMRVVKSFVREDYEKQKFETAAEDVRRDFTKAERIVAFNGPVMQFCLYSVMVFTLSYGSYTIITTKGLSFDVGQLSALTTYGFMMLMSLMMISMIFVMTTLAAESGQRISEVLDEKSSLTSPENALKEVKDGSISFEHVSFAYFGNKSNNVLTDINLEIKSGQTVGIIGATGSSKSSLVQLIPRLYDATEGVVKVGGEDVKKYDLDVLRGEVSMVLQKNVLFSGTIKENLRWGNPEASDEEIVEACKLACADEFIEKLPKKYDYHIEQGGANVSGGQKQRLCIARALISKPKIVIFDDSTSAVDTRTDSAIRKAMREFIPSTTKIIIAQRTASVEDADRILVIDRGSIIADGTHDELMKTSDIYKEIYTSQNKAGGDFDVA